MFGLTIFCEDKEAVADRDIIANEVLWHPRDGGVALADTVLRCSAQQADAVGFIGPRLRSNSYRSEVARRRAEALQRTGDRRR